MDKCTSDKIECINYKAAFKNLNLSCCLGRVLQNFLGESETSQKANKFSQQQQKDSVIDSLHNPSLDFDILANSVPYQLFFNKHPSRLLFVAPEQSVRISSLPIPITVLADQHRLDSVYSNYLGLSSGVNMEITNNGNLNSMNIVNNVTNGCDLIDIAVV